MREHDGFEIAVGGESNREQSTLYYIALNVTNF